MQDLELDKVYQKGSKGRKVKLIQEWLILNNFNLVIDGVFGPATECAVKAFQKAHCLETDGVVRPDTFAQMIAPMTIALRPIDPGNHRALYS